MKLTRIRHDETPIGDGTRNFHYFYFYYEHKDKIFKIEFISSSEGMKLEQKYKYFVTYKDADRSHFYPMELHSYLWITYDEGRIWIHMLEDFNMDKFGDISDTLALNGEEMKKMFIYGNGV